MLTKVINILLKIYPLRFQVEQNTGIFVSITWKDAQLSPVPRVSASQIYLLCELQPCPRREDTYGTGISEAELKLKLDITVDSAIPLEQCSRSAYNSVIIFISQSNPIQVLLSRISLRHVPVQGWQYVPVLSTPRP